jgi:SAM-dependent methyltransferase
MHKRVLSVNSTLFYDHYDDLYTASKDYSAETRAIIDRYRDITGTDPVKVLDVGCGTGNHALILAAGCSVTGIDTDPGMIAVAKGKPGPSDDNPLFIACGVSDLSLTDFDLSVSLFNVISYILDAEKLIEFFRGIHDRLSRRGVLIFDCWNGIAAMFDPPRVKEWTGTLPGGKTASVVTKPGQGPSGETVTIFNDVTINDGANAPVHFSYSYTQRLWTPGTVTDLLSFCGFDVLSIADAEKLTSPASLTTWKIAFICRKRT